MLSEQHENYIRSQIELGSKNKTMKEKCKEFNDNFTDQNIS